MLSRINLEKLAKSSLYLVSFIIPLWVLPFTQNSTDYPKQILLVLLSFIAVVSWVKFSLNKENISLRVSKAYIPFALLLFVAGISSLFSVWPSASFWGLPLSVSQSALSFLAFGFFAMLIANVLREGRQVAELVSLFVIASALAGFVTLLQLYSVVRLPFGIPGLIGTYSSVAMIAAVLLPLALVLLFQEGKRTRALVSFSVFIFTLLLVVINMATAWIVFAVGLLVLL